MMTTDQSPKTGDGADLETLIGLVKHYSPSGEEASAVAWLVERMRRLGYTQAFIDEAGNAVGVMGTGEKQVVFLGHIDTVPGEIPVKISPPLPGDGFGVRGDVLYGRGTVDAKGPLAAFVDSAAAVGPEDGWQFVVIGAIDEERDSIGARYVVDQYRPDFAIIGEPSQWDRVTLGYKGSAWGEIIVRRAQTHSAAQDQSAPEAAVDIWNQITLWTAEFNRDRDRIFNQITPTLRGFSSSEGEFETTATLHIGVRLPVGFGPPDWYEKLQGWTSAVEAELSPKGFPIPAYRSERNSALVRAFLGGIRSADGKPSFVVKTGTADFNIVAPVWGCPIVVYGPGDSNLDHTPNEHLALDEYRRAVQVLQTVLVRITSK
jgi:[amino group carrier protein]-lysine/ornithine hydrolase